MVIAKLLVNKAWLLRPIMLKKNVLDPSKIASINKVGRLAQINGTKGSGLLGIVALAYIVDTFMKYVTPEGH